MTNARSLGWGGGTCLDPNLRGGSGGRLVRGRAGLFLRVDLHIVLWFCPEAQSLARRRTALMRPQWCARAGRGVCVCMDPYLEEGRCCCLVLALNSLLPCARGGRDASVGQRRYQGESKQSSECNVLNPQPSSGWRGGARARRRAPGGAQRAGASHCGSARRSPPPSPRPPPPQPKATAGAGTAAALLSRAAPPPLTCAHAHRWCGVGEAGAWGLSIPGREGEPASLALLLTQ